MVSCDGAVDAACKEELSVVLMPCPFARSLFVIRGRWSGLCLCAVPAAGACCTGPSRHSFSCTAACPVSVPLLLFAHLHHLRFCTSPGPRWRRSERRRSESDIWLLVEGRRSVEPTAGAVANGSGCSWRSIACCVFELGIRLGWWPSACKLVSRLA